MVQFGTGGWRAIIGDGFTRANIRRISAALARQMKLEGQAETGICVGYDRRFLSREAAIWFSEVAAGEGIFVRFVNLSCPTPLVMFTVRNLALPYGAMITASHNPAIYNGIKLFTFGGRDADVDFTNRISAAANSLDPDGILDLPFEQALAEGKIRLIDPRDTYLDSIMAQVDLGAIRQRRPRIVLDPMFGVSLSGLQTILYTARCDLDVINDRHDAFFGRHLPAPNPDTLLDLQIAVKEHNADLGIATDGDADRLGVIDEQGRYVSANELLALLYSYLLEYRGWRGAVIRNVATSHLLDRIAAAWGQECVEVPVGFKHISAAMEKHDALIGGESSGGLTVRGHILGKDGLYAASLLVEVISKTGQPLSRLIGEMYARYGACAMVERDFALTEDSRAAIHQLLMVDKALPDFARSQTRVSYEDGCKVYFGDSAWVIARFSGTEPRIRVFAEGETREEAARLADRMQRFIGINP